MRVVHEVREPGYNGGGLSKAAKTVSRLVRTSPALSVVPVSCAVSSGGVVTDRSDDPVEQRTDVTRLTGPGQADPYTGGLPDGQARCASDE